MLSSLQSRIGIRRLLDRPDGKLSACLDLGRTLARKLDSTRRVRRGCFWFVLGHLPKRIIPCLRMHSNCGDADGAQTLSIKRRGGRLRECLGQVRHVGAGAPTRKQAIVGKSPVAAWSAIGPVSKQSCCATKATIDGWISATSGNRPFARKKSNRTVRSFPFLTRKIRSSLKEGKSNGP